VGLRTTSTTFSRSSFSRDYVIQVMNSGERELCPRVVVVHNPFAEVRLPEDVFAEQKQLVRRHSAMEWINASVAAA
jgi:hypothetical protein